MTPKLKSLIYLTCFILCSVLYNHIEQQESKKSIITSSNLATMEMTDMDENDELTLEKEEHVEKE
ncbi:hypothetical protein [Cellulophaga tyrosinoxydans]|jgi:hypothetical protein|uniref:Uncharacterized protein n=1 Tax=Cellulophaga tyrosinoxydans TaxID=504486 RepID=A0A1W1ZEE4_9FLAO|nr:hypothetical protein [Cellulophaga tyrosinoxydans]SMC46840.1 hypothetical protein SAMN05660703_1416 [Cellulophaga tyrosinoxydans]